MNKTEIAKKTLEVMKTGANVLIGGTVGGVIGLTQGIVKGVSTGLEGNLLQTVVEVFNKKRL